MCIFKGDLNLMTKIMTSALNLVSCGKHHYNLFFKFKLKDI